MARVAHAMSKARHRNQNTAISQLKDLDKNLGSELNDSSRSPQLPDAWCRSYSPGGARPDGPDGPYQKPVWGGGVRPRHALRHARAVRRPRGARGSGGEAQKSWRAPEGRGFPRP